MGGGDDSYFADTNDIVIEYAGQGYDLIYAGADYTLGAGLSVEALGTENNATTAINLTGNELVNYVNGNAGANRLDGRGRQRHAPTASAARTRSPFTTALGAGNVDTIADFIAGTDTIALDDAVFSGIGTAGALQRQRLPGRQRRADADDRIVYNQAPPASCSTTPTATAPARAVLFATLQGAPALSGKRLHGDLNGPPSAPYFLGTIAPGT